jgi:hypothetical protein
MTGPQATALRSVGLELHCRRHAWWVARWAQVCGIAPGTHTETFTVLGTSQELRGLVHWWRDHGTTGAGDATPPPSEQSWINETKTGESLRRVPGVTTTAARSPRGSVAATGEHRALLAVHRPGGFLVLTYKERLSEEKCATLWSTWAILDVRTGFFEHREGLPRPVSPSPPTPSPSALGEGHTPEGLAGGISSRRQHTLSHCDGRGLG